MVRRQPLRRDRFPTWLRAGMLVALLSGALAAAAPAEVVPAARPRAAEPLPPKAPRYLILTADAFYEALQPFAALKKEQGYAVTVTRLSQIPGGSTAEAIRAYIRELYSPGDSPLRYVLLVGDTDTIPAWAGRSAPGATDLYYGCMDEGDDWHPEIALGRFPVRTAEQATIVVDKYLSYARLTGEEPWLHTLSLISTCDPQNWALPESAQNYVMKQYTTPNGYLGRFPYDPQSGGDRFFCYTYRPTDEDIRQALDEGRWLVVHSGHGWPTGWEMEFDAADVRRLNNAGMYPVVLSYACSAGDFAEEEVFGETWLLQENAGALAFFGASVTTNWHEDDILQRAMFDALFTQSRAQVDTAAIRTAGLSAVEATSPEWARYYWEAYNLLGDPALRLFPQARDDAPSSVPGHEERGDGRIMPSWGLGTGTPFDLWGDTLRPCAAGRCLPIAAWTTRPGPAVENPRSLWYTDRRGSSTDNTEVQP